MNKKKFIILTVVIIVIAFLTFRLTPYPYIFFHKPSTSEVISKLPYYVGNKSGWDLILVGSRDGYESMSFQKNEADTFKHIIFAIDENRTPFKVINFLKRYESNGVNYQVYCNDIDTLYAYYINKAMDTVFIRGEYFHKYQNMEFNKNMREFEYFILYKDSLTNVRGDNLPKFPTMTEEEILLFNKLTQ